MSDPTRIFISYSHKDKAWLERLQVVLKPLTRDRSIDPWDDTRIGAGANWRQDIDQALESADAAILLVSADFLASDFITDIELKAILESRAKGMAFFWIPITAALYEDSELEGIQPAWDRDDPIALIKDPEEQRKALVEIARKIKVALKLGKEKCVGIKMEAGGQPISLASSLAEATGKSQPVEVRKEHTETTSKSGTRDTNRVLVTLIDREVQEMEIKGRSLTETGPLLFVVPGPKVQSPNLFISRLKDHTCRTLKEVLNKNNRDLTHEDIGWRTPPRHCSKKEIDARLKLIITEIKAKYPIEGVESLYGESLEGFGDRIFKAIREKQDTNIREKRDTNPRVFVLHLTNFRPTAGERMGFARFAKLWEKLCTEHSVSNVILVFVVSATRAQFKAGYRRALAGLKHTEIVEEMRNIGQDDIETWLRDKQLSTCFNTAKILKQAQAIVPPHEGLPMSILAEKAEGWLNKNRIK